MTSSCCAGSKHLSSPIGRAHASGTRPRSGIAWLQEANGVLMLRCMPAARRRMAMTIFGGSMLGAVLATAAVSFPFNAQRATALTPADELASHRAVYELKLAQTRGNSPAMSARGRILYDFSGNVCDGYALQFRQVSELDNGEGKVTLSDLRSTTWEDGAAKSYIFKSQNYLNETMIDTVDGKAERQADKVAVTLTQPVDKKFDLDPPTA